MEAVPKDKHIPADMYNDEVSLCRATRWDRVDGVEGAEPWGITLQIGTYELTMGCNLI